jgi:HEAT repeat protein
LRLLETIRHRRDGEQHISGRMYLMGEGAEKAHKAADALAKMGPAALVAGPELIACLSNSDIASTVAEVLIKIGRPAVTLLMEALPTSQTEVEWYTRPITGYYGPDKPALRHILYALGKIGDKRAVPAMLELARQESVWDVRNIAMINIMNVDKGHRARLLTLVKNLEDAGEISREQAENHRRSIG